MYTFRSAAIAALLAVTFHVPLAHAGFFTVTTNALAGEGSLLQAIEDANDDPSPSIIAINLADGATITVNHLPAFTRQVSIVTAPIEQQKSVIIAPQSALAYHGLKFEGDGCTLEGVIVQDFIVGVLVSGGGFTMRRSTVRDCGDSGIRTTAAFTAIGHAAGRVYLYGNGRGGTGFRAGFHATTGTGTPDGLQLFNCYIGVMEDGVTAAGNGQQGVLVQSSLGVQIGDSGGNRCVIAGNLAGGILMEGCDNSAVYGSLIGVGADGETPVPNGTSPANGVGIALTGCDTVAIGANGLSNIIANNTSHGIVVGLNSVAMQARNNYIGTEETGRTDFGNGGSGIFIQGSSVNGVISGNTIANNGNHGIEVSGAGSIRNSITGNTNEGIQLTSAGNTGITRPTITSLNPLSGTAPSGGPAVTYVLE